MLPFDHRVLYGRMRLQNIKTPQARQINKRSLFTPGFSTSPRFLLRRTFIMSPQQLIRPILINQEQLCITFFTNSKPFVFPLTSQKLFQVGVLQFLPSVLLRLAYWRENIMNVLWLAILILQYSFYHFFTFQIVLGSPLENFRPLDFPILITKIQFPTKTLFTFPASTVECTKAHVQNVIVWSQNEHRMWHQHNRGNVITMIDIHFHW